jgi:signal peptidase II
MRKLAPWYALALLVVVLDQLTKYWVSASFDYGEARAITGSFSLVLTHNKGAAFSFLSSAAGWQRGFFIGIALIAVVVISALLVRHVGDRLFCLALALILGGAIGNVLDRIALGYVVDFLDFYVAGCHRLRSDFDRIALGYVFDFLELHIFPGCHWPAFNLADSAITTGAVLLIVDSFRPAARRTRAPR